MAWTIEYDPRAIDDLNRMDRPTKRAIVEYLEARIASATDPRSFGKALRHSLGGLWRYRVRDYRIICEIKNDILTVLVVGVGHRRDVYR